MFTWNHYFFFKINWVYLLWLFVTDFLFHLIFIILILRCILLRLQLRVFQNALLWSNYVTIRCSIWSLKLIWRCFFFCLTVFIVFLLWFGVFFLVLICSVSLFRLFSNQNINCFWNKHIIIFCSYMSRFWNDFPCFSKLEGNPRTQ